MDTKAPPVIMLDRPALAASLLRRALEILDCEGLSMPAIHVSMALGSLGENEIERAEPRVCVV